MTTLLLLLSLALDAPDLTTSDIAAPRIIEWHSVAMPSSTNAQPSRLYEFTVTHPGVQDLELRTTYDGKVQDPKHIHFGQARQKFTIRAHALGVTNTFEVLAFTATATSEWSNVATVITAPAKK